MFVSLQLSAPSRNEQVSSGWATLFFKNEYACSPLMIGPVGQFT